MIFGSNPVNPQVVAINSTSTAVDPSIDLVVILHGFTGSVASKSVTLIRDALLFKQNVTVVAVQWANLARGPWYDVAVANTLSVAQHLYRFLLKVEESGLDLMRVHIIGFSLGAHAAGITGSMLEQRLGRITGLDPARPGFEKVNNTGRLDASDANFVVGLHTGAGFVAMSEAVGHVDFYPNGGSRQPHCLTDDIPLVCNHFMAYTYFAESIYNPEAFPAHSCASWADFDNGLCDDNDVIPMGYSTPNSAKGLYFLRTNAQEPYGLGQGSRRVDHDIEQLDTSGFHGSHITDHQMTPELSPAKGGHREDIYSVDGSNKPGLKEQNSNEIAAATAALDPDVRRAPRHCEPRFTLLTDHLPGSPVIVAAPVNGVVVLLCSFCGEEDAVGDDVVGAVWRVDDLVNGLGPRPVQLEQKRGGKWPRLGHHDGRRVFLGDRHELVLRGASEKDVGLYSCSHLQGVDRGRPFQYLLDLDRGNVAAVRGSEADYRAYRRSTLQPLTAALKAAGSPLEAASSWRPWGPCVNCSRSGRGGGGDGSGRRERLAACRLRVPQQGPAVDLGGALRIIGDPLSALPCRSTLLAAALPNISALSKDVPDFVEVDAVSCDGHCVPPPRRRLPWRPEPPAPVPRVDYEVEEGDDLTVLCPGSTMESAVHWERDGMELEDPAEQVPARARVGTTTTKKPGFFQRWKARRKKLTALARRRGRRRRPAVRVDWTGALRLEAPGVDESGLYSCGLVDGVTALVVDIRVVRKKPFTISGERG
ncbi:Lipase member I [Frankliniella fusca]|uniref:Lipase member I n=1 Tax=Frankliniella fusca TaxID=407009 RepID=A0AAE1I2Z6_9NEOP|nr:Lipase member I [Frankliniella fusca]